MKEKKIKPKNEDAKALRKEIDALQEQLETVQNERDELLGKLQRVSADYANFQKRIPKQVNDSVAYEKERLIRTMLPVLDNFEHTLEKSHAAEGAEAVLEGVRIIYDQMAKALKAHGVEQIHALNEPFDPALHEAMLRKEDPDREDGIVLEEHQKGYRLGDRVIQPCKVVVNRVPTPEPAETEETTPSESQEAPEPTTDEDPRPSDGDPETE